jgi:hypothetical protein
VHDGEHAVPAVTIVMRCEHATVHILERVALAAVTSNEPRSQREVRGGEGRAPPRELARRVYTLDILVHEVILNEDGSAPDIHREQFKGLAGEHTRDYCVHQAAR